MEQVTEVTHGILPASHWKATILSRWPFLPDMEFTELCGWRKLLGPMHFLGISAWLSLHHNQESKSFKTFFYWKQINTKHWKINSKHQVSKEFLCWKRRLDLPAQRLSVSPQSLGLLCTRLWGDFVDSSGVFQACFLQHIANKENRAIIFLIFIY